MEIGISLGSNLGNRLEFLKRARDCLVNLSETSLLIQSSVYSSSPVNVKLQYENFLYYNSIIIIETNIPLKDWWNKIEIIELILDRERTQEKNIPRTIDIDLIYADQEVVNYNKLIIPHPRWSNRKFVIKPLCEVRPDLVLPNMNYTVKTILENLVSDEDVQIKYREW